jgi:predicted phosphodiesterase
MQKPLSVSEREAKCYEYFHTNNIKNRDELRSCWKTNPITGVRANFIEDMFSDFQDLKKFREKRADEIKTTTDFHKTFVLSDMHIPFQDDNTIRNVFDCIVDNQPKYIVLLGDILDCYSLSRFLKNPGRYRNLQDEIDIFYKMMRSLMKEIPTTEIHYVLGNHENRLSTLVKEKDGLYGLKGLEPEQIFRLDELGIPCHRTKVVIDDFIYYHGDVVRKDSAYSAKQEFYDHNCHSGISGHTHRAGSYYKTYAKEVGFWLENGCLCKMDPDYINDPDKANWQHCINVIDSYDGLNQGTQIIIHDHKFTYNGKIYK